MKKMFFALLLISTVSQAQYRFRYDKLFMEAGMGMAIPLSGISPSGDGNGFISLIHLQGGLRYMFTENVGLLGNLNFDQFEDSNHQKSEQKMASLELCYNLGNLIDISRNTGGQFGLLAHAGAGLGTMDSKYVTKRDYIEAILIGVKPYVFINEKVSLFGDLTYKATLAQDTYFNGVTTTYPSPGQFSASQLGITFGFIVALGQNRFHADSAY